MSCLSDLLSRVFPGCVRSRARHQEVTLRVDDAGPVGLDRVEVCFDDEKVVSDAGIMLVATLAERLGVQRLVDDTSAGRSAEAVALLGSPPLTTKSIDFLDKTGLGLLASLTMSGPTHAHLIAPIPFDAAASNAEARLTSGARCRSTKRSR
jgi:hypothetical protein